MSERISNLRQEIDDLDRQLLAILGKRFECAIQIGAIKKDEQMDVLDSLREAVVITDRKEIATEHGVDAVFCERILKLIMEEARRLQAEQ